MSLTVPPSSIFVTLKWSDPSNLLASTTLAIKTSLYFAPKSITFSISTKRAPISVTNSSTGKLMSVNFLSQFSEIIIRISLKIVIFQIKNVVNLQFHISTSLAYRFHHPKQNRDIFLGQYSVSYTHLRAHETDSYLV